MKKRKGKRKEKKRKKKKKTEMKDKFGNEVDVGDKMYFIDQVHGKGYGSPYLRIGKIAKVEPCLEGGHMATLEWEEVNGNVFTEERRLTDIAKAYEGEN